VSSFQFEAEEASIEPRNFRLYTASSRRAVSAGWLYKQSQFADRDREGRRPTKSSAGPLVGPIAPNKPNWEGPSAGRDASVNKQSRCGGSGGGQPRAVVQTKPIGWRGRPRQTNPIGPAPPEKGAGSQTRSRRGDNRAKQSHFAKVEKDHRGDSESRLKAVLRTAYKQTQFALYRPQEALAARAASAAAAGDKRAKQSQFRQSDVRGKYCVEKEL
jgi:hypothetical protein